jgi:arsenate reductase
MITIYHNPRCGKSRECLAFLESKNQSFEVVKYLESPLNYEELSSLIHKLNLSPIDLIRTKESIWIENYKGKALSNEEIISLMVAHPILIERPIVVYKNKAIIARPLSKIEAIL